MKQFILTVVLTSLVVACFMEIVFPPTPKSINVKSSNECVDDLLGRYHEGYFTAARHSVLPVSMREDSETIRLRNQLLELQHENNLLRQKKQIEENHIYYIIQLLETKEELVQSKSRIGKHDQESHAAIDQLLSWIQDDLKNHKVETELDELYIKRQMELRNHEETNGN